jgi:Shikimate kinase
METKILKEHINDAGIISTGGGIIESKINRQIISDSCAQVIFLEADFSTILRRLSKDTDRPLLRKLSMQALLNRWSSRQPLYKKTSDVVISTNGKSPNKIVNELIDIFNLPDNPLTSLRSEIDSLDTQILNLISQRMNIVKQVADVKKNVGMSVIQSKRMDKMRLDLKTEFKNNPNISEDFIDELVSLLTSNAISKEVDLIS